MYQLIEYMKIHLISLEQDFKEVEDKMEAEEDLNGDTYNELDVEHISLTGQIIATRHLLSVANDIIADLLTSPIERK